MCCSPGEILEVYLSCLHHSNSLHMEIILHVQFNNILLPCAQAQEVKWSVVSVYHRCCLSAQKVPVLQIQAILLLCETLKNCRVCASFCYPVFWVALWAHLPTTPRYLATCIMYNVQRETMVSLFLHYIACICEMTVPIIMEAHA